MSGAWRIEWPSGSIADRHALEPELTNRGVRVHEVDRPTMVLGSSQHGFSVVGNIDVVKRRSGGGAVLLRPSEVLWMDVLLPRGDSLWDDDLGRAALWLGEVWCATLRKLGIGAEVFREPITRNRWSDLVCFAGRAPGEILVNGRKVVGISQRRNKIGARFQCGALIAWPAEEMVRFLELQPGEEALEALQASAGPLPIGQEELQMGFLDQLP